MSNEFSYSLLFCIINGPINKGCTVDCQATKKANFLWTSIHRSCVSSSHIAVTADNNGTYLSEMYLLRHRIKHYTHSLSQELRQCQILMCSSGSLPQSHTELHRKTYIKQELIQEYAPPSGCAGNRP